MALSFPLIVHSFDEEYPCFDVNGISCHDGLDAMMCIMEHEITHIIEFELYGKSYCSKRPFKTLAFRIFGHTTSKHRIGLKDENSYDHISIPLGSKVRFDHKGHIYTGTLMKITKRATVMVDPSCKSRYNKFYVPLDQLSVVS